MDQLPPEASQADAQMQGDASARSSPTSSALHAVLHQLLQFLKSPQTPEKQQQILQVKV